VLDNIPYILTLRYIPTNEYLLPQMNWTNYDNKIQENYSQKVELLLKDSIKKFFQKHNPKKIAIALSGGVDSILTLTLTKELFPDIPITAISFGFDEDDTDVQQARMIAEKFNIDFESTIFKNFMNNLPEQISIIKEPKFNYYWYEVAKKGKEKANILLTGDGSDELFGGYIFRYSKYLKLIKTSFSWREKVKAYLECHNRDWVPDQHEIFGNKIKFSWEKIYNIFRKYFDNNLNVLDQVFLSDYMGKLMFDWMPCYKKIYDHIELKGFSPMLNPTLINYTSRIPSQAKYDVKNNVGKLILREILRRKNIQIDSSKKGFGPNLLSFWNSFGSEIISCYLRDSRIVANGWISQEWIDKSIIRTHESNDIRYINKLLHITSFEIWCRLFVTNEMKSYEKLL
jgi:asparagine synthase (glutamine-hydrolysing)